MALPGLVDAARGALLVAPNLGWNDVAVVDELHERLSGPSFPLAADNEANLAALAELWEGTARGLSDVLYVSGEIGVGAGIIVSGELFRGSQGFGGEFGHMTIDPNGPAVRVRQPRLPGDAGGAGAAARAGRARPEPTPRPPPARASRCPSSPRAPGWATSRRSTRCARPAAGSGIGIASAANLLNFQAVVLGGFFAQLATWLAAPIARELETHVLASEWGVPRLLPSTLGPEAAVRGAAALSLRRVLTDPASAEAA